MEPFPDGVEHLLAELERLDLLLRREVERLRAARLFQDDPFRGLHISDDQVNRLLHTDESANSPDSEWSQRAEELAIRNRERALPTLPFPTMVGRFGLNDFEASVLLLAVASDVDDRYATLFAYTQNDVTRKRPTAGLALRLFHDTPAARLQARVAFAPSAPLFAHRLVRFGDDAADRDPPLPARPLCAAGRVVESLLGRTGIDPGLASVCEFEPTPAGIHDVPHSDDLKRRLGSLAAHLANGGAGVFQGPAGSGRQCAAGAVFEALGRSLLRVDAREFAEWNADMAALVIREAMLLGAGVYAEGCETACGDDPAARRTLRTLHELAAAPVPLILGTTEPLSGLPRPVPVVAFAPLPFAPRLRLWEAALNGCGTRITHADLADVANTYALGPDQIASATGAAKAAADLRDGDLHAVTAADLRAAAAAHAGPTLRRLGRRVETPHTWDDLIVPPDTLRRLREITAAVRYRPVVYAEWGFERRLAYGRGVAALFSGPSGTGKTMAAAILARDLGTDLYAIDLSAVVSKYIGETEKNLSRVFDEARRAHAMLFFDEADALFGKRSAVQDAHDRYANIEVAFLLQKLEEFDGVVVLATNLPKNVDDAFARRIRHAVEFPFPDARHRERLWRSIFPPGVPLAADMDVGFLAQQFELSGGNIRNVALAAAFRAAARQGEVGMGELIPAVAQEIQKAGKLPAKADFGAYYPLLREAGDEVGGAR